MAIASSLSSPLYRTPSSAVEEEEESLSSLFRRNNSPNNDNRMNLSRTSTSSSGSDADGYPPLMRTHSHSQSQQQSLFATHNNPNSFLEHHDESREEASLSSWSDIIVEPSNGNSNNNNNNAASSRNTVQLQIPSLVYDSAACLYEWTYSAMEVWVELLTAPPISRETLQKVSIVLLGVEKLRDNLDQSTLLHQVLFAAHVGNTVTVSSNGSIVVGPAGTHAAIHNLLASGTATNATTVTLASIPQYLLWGIPAAIAMLSVSFVLTLQMTWGHQEEAVIATALILLIFLEALLPLFILGCTSMFLFQQVTWETGLSLLVIVWLGSTFCAHCIRRMLYQSLGHG